MTRLKPKALQVGDVVKMHDSDEEITLVSGRNDRGNYCGIGASDFVGSVNESNVAFVRAGTLSDKHRKFVKLLENWGS